MLTVPIFNMANESNNYFREGKITTVMPCRYTVQHVVSDRRSLPYVKLVQ